MSKFQANLVEASRAEVAIVSYLEKQGYKAWLNPEKNGDCDVYVNIQGKTYLVEVKTDFASIHTGNIAVEPQTLEHTKSHYFAYLIPQVKFIPTADVRNLYFEYYQSGKNGGDQGKRQALIPKSRFL